MTTNIAYLDHAASTPMRAEAVEAMLPYLTECYANATGAHAMARAARRVIDERRDEMAALLGAEAGEIVFCATGSEADNLAIFGVTRARGGIAVTTAAEHHAVLHPVEALKGRIVGVDSSGRVDLNQLEDALDDRVSVVSVMAVNNEVGTITPMAEVAEVVRRRAPQAVLHSDAVQALTWIDLRQVAQHVDAMSLSGHKFGGPKGVGVLMVRKHVGLAAMVLGGGQERARRSGTHDTAGIAALTTAATLTHDGRVTVNDRVRGLRDRLVDTLMASVDGVIETVGRADKVAGNAHVCFAGLESEALLFLLDRAGVYCSAGSSCASGAVQISHVLAAMAIDRELAAGSIRFSLGQASTEADIDRVLDVVPGAVAQLRR